MGKLILYFFLAVLPLKSFCVIVPSLEICTKDREEFNAVLKRNAESALDLMFDNIYFNNQSNRYFSSTYLDYEIKLWKILERFSDVKENKVVCQKTLRILFKLTIPNFSKCLKKKLENQQHNKLQFLYNIFLKINPEVSPASYQFLLKKQNCLKPKNHFKVYSKILKIL